MSRWKALPVGLDPAAVRLVVELRRVKDASGLTLRQVADRTGYSASSWDRYLGGRLLPPREAVEALAEASRVDPVRLVALCDAAADTWGRQGAVATAALATADVVDQEPDEAGSTVAGGGGDAPVPATAVTAASRAGDTAVTTPGLRARRGQLLRQALTIVTSAAAGAVVAILCVQPGHNTPDAATNRPVAVAKRIAYACTFVQRGGQWYAGNSDSSSTALVVDMSGPAVAELQCLLQHAGITPGGIDGDFGPLTESAVIKAQKAFHLDVDGQVGPHTWAALRR